MNKKLNILGLISMLLALLGLFVFGIPCGIASLVLGIIGIVTAREDKGIGMAVTGTVIGAFDLLTVLFLLNIVSAY